MLDVVFVEITRAGKEVAGIVCGAHADELEARLYPVWRDAVCRVLVHVMNASNRPASEEQVRAAFEREPVDVQMRVIAEMEPELAFEFFLAMVWEAREVAFATLAPRKRVQ